MNIVYVPPQDAVVIYLFCIDCGKRMVLSKAEPPIFADLNGEAFKAYYCRPCVNKFFPNGYPYDIS
jgi:hypothetical protein